MLEERDLLNFLARADLSPRQQHKTFRILIANRINSDRILMGMSRERLLAMEGLSRNTIKKIMKRIEKDNQL